MTYTYSLRIETDVINRESLENIIGLKANTELFTWEYELEEKEEDEPVFFIKRFMDIIEDKLPILDSLGVKREEITM
jgi:hypothetical protein